MAKAAGMDDKDCFTHALGLQVPWEIREVQVDLEAQRVEVEVACAQTVWADPETRQRPPLPGYEERRWRHLDPMQLETLIKARVPRLKYPDGHPERLPPPWAELHSRHTLCFEAWAIKILSARRALQRRMQAPPAQMGRCSLDHGARRGARACPVPNRSVENRGFGREEFLGWSSAILPRITFFRFYLDSFLNS
jgi:hypothetical protein